MHGLARPEWCYPAVGICRLGPREICRLPDESTAPTTRTTDRASETTIVKDLQQPRPITVHHINARN